MKRVTGIGGIFFKAKDPKALGQWYKTHLGMNVESWGGAVFRWADDKSPEEGTTVWNLVKDDPSQFSPSKSSFMINYRVDDLETLVAVLKDEGCDVDDKVEDTEFGKFGWVMDPEGNRLELWQPPSGD
ncbi:MAG: VOC family protein [Phycisphaerales bacterium]|nr:VOC family protein [Phycisphaerales bacterium]